jgi:hypothetical protein
VFVSVYVDLTSISLGSCVHWRAYQIAKMSSHFLDYIFPSIFHQLDVNRKIFDGKLTQNTIHLGRTPYQMDIGSSDRSGLEEQVLCPACHQFQVYNPSADGVTLGSNLHCSCIDIYPIQNFAPTMIALCRGNPHV